MTKKSFILSSSGLQNIVVDQVGKQNEFKFLFGEHELKLNRIFAEFLSPFVSKLHQTDPTINSIDIKSFFNRDPKIEIFNYKELFTEDIISILKNISIGVSAEMSEEQSSKLRIISIIFGNDELYGKINELFPKEIEEKNIN